MTPPIFLASVFALLWLLGRGQWRLFILLVGWLILMLAPLIFMGTVMRSRYALAGVIPLLLALAYMLADILGWLLSGKLPAALGWIAATLLMVGLLAWPAFDLHLQLTNWQGQPLVAADRAQYLTGWSAGSGVRAVIQTVRRVAADGDPLVIITDDGWGTPSDALWVYLQDLPNVQMAYINDLEVKNDERAREASTRPILLPAAAAADGTARYWLRQDKYRYTAAVPLAIPAGVTVLYITQQDSSEHNFAAILQARNEIITTEEFHNPGDHPGEVADDRVVIYQLQ